MIHPRRIDLLRHFTGENPENSEDAFTERLETEQHVQMCDACKEYGEFVRMFAENMKVLRREDLAPSTSCPDSWTFASYVSGEVDSETARRINAHIGFCEQCFEMFLSLADDWKLWDTFCSAKEEPADEGRSATDMYYDVDERVEDDIKIVRVHGHLTSDKSNRFRFLMDGELGGRTSRVLLDLNDLIDIDTYGVSTLLVIFETAKSEGKEIKIMGPTGRFPNLRRWFEVLDTADEGAAIRSFSVVPRPDRPQVRS